MDFLGGVREVGGQQGVDVADNLQRGPQYGAQAFALGVILGQLPWLHRRNVGVGFANNMHGVGDASFEAVVFQGFTNDAECVCGQVEDRLVFFGQLPGGRYLAEGFVRHRHGAVDQVAPAVGELVVDASDKLVPGEVGVGVFRTCHGDEVAQRVGAEVFEEVLDVNDHALGGGELRTRHGQVFRRDNLGGKLQFAELAGFSPTGAFAAVTQQFSGPNLGVEGDVVFAHEVVGQSFRIGPEGAPRVGVAGAVGPLDGCGQVAHHGVEPHVELFGVVVLPTFDRYRNTPVDVAGHRAGADVVKQVEGEFQHVGAPILTGGQPLGQRLSESRKVQKEVFGFDELGGFTVDFADRVDQVCGVELVAAVVALVAACSRRATDGAGAFDVAVRQGAAGGGGDCAEGGLFDHVAVGVEAFEQLLHHRVVVTGGGAGEQVVGQA